MIQMIEPHPSLPHPHPLLPKPPPKNPLPPPQQQSKRRIRIHELLLPHPEPQLVAVKSLM